MFYLFKKRLLVWGLSVDRVAVGGVSVINASRAARLVETIIRVRLQLTEVSRQGEAGHGAM